MAEHRRRLPIGVGGIVVRIHHLHFVLAHEEDAAVAALLPFAGRGRGSFPFHVKLRVPKRARRGDVPGSVDDLDVASLDLPPGRGATRVGVTPVGQIVAIEQHDGVSWRRHGVARRTWVNDRWLGPVHRMDRPLGRDLTARR